MREVLAQWLEAAQGWAPDPEAIVVLPDAVRGIELAVLAHTLPWRRRRGAWTPVYPPFLSAVRENDRRLRRGSKLVRRGRRCFPLDLDVRSSRRLADGARMVLLCHPHNPTGHVNATEDLVALAELRPARAGAKVLSDEIHAPLMLDGRRHVPFATVSPAAAECVVTVTSASKAWNTPGLKTAFLIAEAEEMRAPIMAMAPRTRHGCSILGLEASIAALRDGGPWLDAVLTVLARNQRTVVVDAPSTPRCSRGSGSCRLRATYLAWLDCRELGLADGPQAFFLERARVALSDGAAFGAQAARPRPAQLRRASAQPSSRRILSSRG